MASKRKASALASSSAPAPEEPVDPADELMFLCLGGGNEVGRSCHIIQYKGKTVMLDAGQHPAYDGLAALPFFDDFDLGTVDVLLISHFHVDHAASLPYVLAKTNFRGRVFMTHPTKAIYKWLIQDSVRVGNTSSNPTSQPVYTEQDHLNTFPQIEAIDYHTTHTISSIRITPYPAGHVLGAAMFLIEIAGLNIFFTGDYSREQDRHLVSAEVPRGVKIDVLITESTYGIASHVPRLEREQALMKSITSILGRGGRVLMPVFALGRAQELLLILDEYWARHPEFRKVPIYYASNLARKCMLVYQTYVGAMNDNIKRLFRERMAEAEADGGKGGGGGGGGGPWDFKYIRSLKNLDRFDDVGGCVMLASPGMLQSGVSRELLERWAPSEKNGVVITGYSVEGTMAKQILQEPDHIQAVATRNAANSRRAPGGGGGGGGGGSGGGGGGDGEKVMIPRRCTVHEYSFAAHVDGTENREFIEEVAAPVVILVHGEQHNMMRLKSKLLSLNAGKADRDKVKVYSPRNCEELRIPFKADKRAKVVGKLASMPMPVLLPPPKGEIIEGGEIEGEGGETGQQQQQQQLITGVLVQNDFKLSLMAPEDLREYAGLATTTITCRQRLRLGAAGVDLIKWGLEGTFGTVHEKPETKPNGKSNGNHKNGNGNGNGDMDLDYDIDIDLDEVVATFTVMGCVTVRCRNSGEVELEWEANMLSDGVADAVMAVLLSVESSPAAVKRSASKHAHTHMHASDPGPVVLPHRNLHANLTPEERLERLFMFLEAQFGADNVSPIADPKLPLLPSSSSDGGDTGGQKSKEEDGSDASMELSEEEDGSNNANANNGDEEKDGKDGKEKVKTRTKVSKIGKDDMGVGESSSEKEKEEKKDDEKLRAQTELARLHKLGIPVPGVRIKVDKMEAVVWLEDLEVECGNRVFADRVRAVVERAVEVTAPLWG